MSSTATVAPSGSKPETPTNRHLAERPHVRGDVNQAAELFLHYPESVREDANWLWFFCKTKCNAEHALLGKIAAALGLKDRSNKVPSDQYWYQVVTGRYFNPGGDAKTFGRYVAAFRGYARQQEQSGQIPFQETKNWELFRDYIDTRRTFSSSCRVGGIEGLSGSQKTWCGKHYAALHNHRETVHMEAPARATRSRVVQKLAELYLVPESKSGGGKEIEVERFLKGATTITEETIGADGERKPRTILIDNVQRLFRPGVPPDQQPVFNYFHELQDDTGFCLILTWVPSFTKTITGSHPFWAQFLGRIGGPDEILRLDQALPKSDLVKFARAFRVVDDRTALPLLKKWSSTVWGIRVFMRKLERARKLATARGEEEISVSILQEIDLDQTPVVTNEEDAS